MKILSALVLCVLMTGCVVTPYGYVAASPEMEVVYESDVVAGLYPLGYYNPEYGYWNGASWDVDFYLFGHPGYGHYYRGAPHSAMHGYRQIRGGHAVGHHH